MTYKFEGRGLSVEKASRVTIFDPKDWPLREIPLTAKAGDVTFTAYVEVFSADSRRAEAHLQQIEDRAAANQKRRTRVERDGELADYLAHMTVGWCIITPDGDVVDEPFSEEAARAMYRLPEWEWFREQAQRAVESRKNFMPGRPTL